MPSLVTPRDPVVVEKRRPLKRWEIVFLTLDQAGLCGCGCDRPLLCPEGFIDEHVMPLWLGGTNDILNRKLYRKGCARIKTDREATWRAKTERQSGGRGSQTARRERNGSRLQSRGFDKRFTKKMDGTVVERDHD